MAACVSAAQVAAQTPPAPSKVVPAVLPAVVARVNGQDVTKEDFEKMIRMAEANAGMTIPPERRDGILRQLLDELVVHTLLEQEASHRALAATDADVDTRLRDLRQRFPTQAEFDDALKERGLTLDALRHDVRRDIAAEKLMSAELAAVPAPSDDEAKDYYAKNPDKFKEEESIRASHILIRMAPDADAATKAKAKAAIDQALQRAKGGEDFAKLAQEFSQDPGSAVKGGDLNYFKRGMMVPEFNDAAFALQPGQLSDVVTTQYGYHIIKVTDRKPGRMMPFEEAAPRIKQFLEQQKKQDRRKAVIEELKTKAKIEVLI
jgi:peptidyl-prolyl cis-trans isomerase C